MLRADVLRGLQDCTQTDAVIDGIFDTNPKTGSKLRKRKPVKHKIARNAATRLVEFIAGIQAGGAINSAKFYTEDLQALAASFAEEKFTWRTLIEEMPADEDDPSDDRRRDRSDYESASTGELTRQVIGTAEVRAAA